MSGIVWERPVLLAWSNRVAVYDAIADVNIGCTLIISKNSSPNQYGYNFNGNFISKVEPRKKTRRNPKTEETKEPGKNQTI